MTVNALVVTNEGSRLIKIEGKLEPLQEVVGGWLEAVSFPEYHAHCYIDEEGKLKSLSINEPATKLARALGWETPDILCGPAIFLSMDEEGEEASVPTAVVNKARELGLVPTPPAPRFGLAHVIPDSAVAAWGTRLIVTQNGDVDFVMDRQDGDGPRIDELLDLQTARIGVRDMRELIGSLLRSGVMQTRVAEDFILYMDDDIVVHANTNASAGYCYVTAWLYDQEAEKN